MRAIYAGTVLIALLALQTATARSTGRNVKSAEGETNGCSYSLSKDILSADCNGLGLTAVPQDLKPDIEMLDLRSNKIVGGNFTRYTLLKVLILDSNDVRSLDALEGLENLEELSIVSNSLEQVPPTLARKLPQLRRFDISRNPLREPIGASQLIAPFCQLQELHLAGETEKALDFCDCIVLHRWVEEGLLVSPPEALSCLDREGMTDEMQCLRSMPEAPSVARSQCLEQQEARLKRDAADDAKKLAWWVWLVIALGIIIVLVFAGFILNCFCNFVVCCAGCVCCAACKCCEKLCCCCGG